MGCVVLPAEAEEIGGPSALSDGRGAFFLVGRDITTRCLDPNRDTAVNWLEGSIPDEGLHGPSHGDGQDISWQWGIRAFVVPVCVRGEGPEGTLKHLCVIGAEEIAQTELTLEIVNF